MARCSGGTKATVHCHRAIEEATTGHRPASGRTRLRAALMALIRDTGPLYAARDEADTEKALLTIGISGLCVLAIFPQ